MKYMSYNKNDIAFKEANRKTFKELQGLFGPGNSLEDLLYHKNFICLFYSNVNMHSAPFSAIFPAGRLCCFTLPRPCTFTRSP